MSEYIFNKNVIERKKTAGDEIIIRGIGDRSIMGRRKMSNRGCRRQVGD